MKPSDLLKTSIGVFVGLSHAAPIADSQIQHPTPLPSSQNTITTSSSNSTLNDTQVSSQWSYFMYWDNPEWHYHNEKQDFECETYSSLFYPYTGYRLLRKYELTLALFPVKTSLKFVFCHRGRVVAEQLIDYNEQTDAGRPLFRWDRTFCITSREPFTPDARGCFRMARRARYTDFGLPLYPREAFIGGLFRCPTDDPTAPCDQNEAVSPAAPLIADEPYAGVFELHNPWKFLYHEPLFYTPDYYSQVYPRYSEMWARFIDINEEYDADTIVVSKNGIKKRIRRSKKYTSSSRPGSRPKPGTNNQQTPAAVSVDSLEEFNLFDETMRMVEPYLPRAISHALFSSFPRPSASSSSSSSSFSAPKFARIVAALGAMPDRRAAARIYHTLVVRANGREALPDPRIRLADPDLAGDAEHSVLFSEWAGARHNGSEYETLYNNKNGWLAKLNVFKYYRPRTRIAKQQTVNEDDSDALGNPSIGKTFPVEAMKRPPKYYSDLKPGRDYNNYHYPPGSYIDQIQRKKEMQRRRRVGEHYCPPGKRCKF
ncbi:uncharacterized protein SAPINGB_P004568 [Magnusiomyces paraingens]|uniref:Uncharacterized protein n=1 Tax=Magnusiomyces paraingens TaxID=2606893 RepID=A0A5E8BW97_9ASCO|nr:uncharacterized protein SAPINGB_P004568 [Saprochaete ingens]VVT55381.1 unnamed protein product [Saprochaete ingens]